MSTTDPTARRAEIQARLDVDGYPKHAGADIRWLLAELAALSRERDEGAQEVADLKVRIDNRDEAWRESLAIVRQRAEKAESQLAALSRVQKGLRDERDALERAARILREWACDRQSSSGKWTQREQAGVECAICLEQLAAIFPAPASQPEEA
jgi:chromosome segregation ATPase